MLCMEDLKEWAKIYVKHKDIMKKEIVSINNTDTGFNVKYKDRDCEFIIVPELKEGDIKGLSDDKNRVLVLLNSKKNLDFIIKKWNTLKVLKNLAIYFVNPASSSDKVWILRPYVHNSICDNSSLATGLKSIFGGVEEVR